MHPAVTSSLCKLASDPTILFASPIGDQGPEVCPMLFLHLQEIELPGFPYLDPGEPVRFQVLLGLDPGLPCQVIGDDVVVGPDEGRI